MRYLVRLDGPRSGITDISFDAAEDASAADLQRLAREAIAARLGRSHDFPGDITYDVYRDADDDNTPDRNERLGLNSSNTVGSWNAGNGLARFNRRFTASVVPHDGDTPTGYVEGMPSSLHLPDSVRTGLTSIVFRSNGESGVQREEALSFVREFERLFRGRTFEIDGHDVSGEDLMRDVIASGHVRMGPSEGNLYLQDVYRVAGLDPSQATSRTDADIARLLGETPTAGGAGDPTGASDPSITTFLNNPTPGNAARLRADRARTDELINILLAALASGNTDVLTTAMDLVANNGRGTVAELAMNTIAKLRALDQQIARINDQVQGLDTGSENNATRSRALGEFQRLQVQLNTLNAQRQAIVGMLETTLRAMEEENRTAQRVREGYDRAHRAGMG